jgi:peptide/nickel transport system permease protein
MTAGYLGGRIDDSVTFVTNLFLIVPPLPAAFVLLLGSTSPPSLGKIILLLALATWAPGARIMRSQMLSVRTRDFVLAAVTCGERRWRLIAIEILPHLSGLVLYLLVNSVLLTMVTEFNLEFLGLFGANGDIAGNIGWGNLLWNASYDGELVAGDWWVWAFPALGIALSVVSLALINVGLDRLWRARTASPL